MAATEDMHPKSPFLTLADIAEKRDYAEGPIQAGLADSCNVASASPADLNRYAARDAKYKCTSGHRGLHWDAHFRVVLCSHCGSRFANLDPLREQVVQQGQGGNWDVDEYMRGMFNGLECALATLESREPRYR